MRARRWQGIHRTILSSHLSSIVHIDSFSYTHPSPSRPTSDDCTPRGLRAQHLNYTTICFDSRRHRSWTNALDTSRVRSREDMVTVPITCPTCQHRIPFWSRVHRYNVWPSSQLPAERHEMVWFTRDAGIRSCLRYAESRYALDR